ncbi:MAG: HD domain-containing protein, partial [Endomicrobiales bacterium]
MFDDLTLIKKKLTQELEAYFGADHKRIDHAKKVLRYAEELLREEQADPYVVIPAALLHDVGIKAAEAKHGSAAAQ